jgi:hypothetical protein
MGPSRFTFHPRGRCAADFYRPKKIHRLGRVLNPQPLGSVSSTLATKATEMQAKSKKPFYE